MTKENKIIKSTKVLSTEEMKDLDVKKVMNNIKYLETITDICENSSVLEMYKTMNDLYWISDRGLIKLGEFRTNSKRLEEIGKKFKVKCLCRFKTDKEK